MEAINMILKNAKINDVQEGDVIVVTLKGRAVKVTDNISLKIGSNNAIFFRKDAAYIENVIINRKTETEEIQDRIKELSMEIEALNNRLNIANG